MNSVDFLVSFPISIYFYLISLFINQFIVKAFFMQQPCSSASLEVPKDGGDGGFSREFIDQIFAQCDYSGTGFIAIKKLKIVMRALGLEPRQDEIDKITKKMLENEVARSVNEDAFCAEELAYVLADRFKQTEEVKDEIHSAFKLFDVDGKGFITVDDLRRISAELGENLTEDELREMINTADSTKSGRVTPSGFKVIMEKIALY